MNKSRHDTYKLLRVVLLLIALQTLLIVVAMLIGTFRSVDMLVYSTRTYIGQPTELVLFDPQHHVHLTIFRDIQLSVQFSVSADGHIAFSSEKTGDAELFVWNTQLPHIPPINISQTVYANEYALSWSHDSRYLAFASYTDDDTQIYVWDGTTTHNITPDDWSVIPRHFFTSWSNDGRLAFATLSDSLDSYVLYGFELYLWNGNTTSNLSQNPMGNDIGLAWNTDGQFAFLSQSERHYDLLLWDGVSVVNDAPDKDTFIHILPDLSIFESNPTWTNTGLLAFTAAASGDIYHQIYVWDGQTATNLSQNDDQLNNNPTWNINGQWAFTAFNGGQQSVIVRDSENHTLLVASGYYDAAWSSSDDLILCLYVSSLHLWDGNNIRRITEAGEISAQWQSGERAYCSAG